MNHMRHEGTLDTKHVWHKAREAQEHVEHEALRHRSTQGSWAHRASNLADSQESCILDAWESCALVSEVYLYTKLVLVLRQIF